MAGETEERLSDLDASDHIPQPAPSSFPLLHPLHPLLLPNPLDLFPPTQHFCGVAGQALTVRSYEVSASSLVPLSAQLSSGVECRQPNTRLRPPYGTTVSKIGINFMCSHNSYVLTSLCFSRLHVPQSSMVLTALCSSKLYGSHDSMYLKAL